MLSFSRFVPFCVSFCALPRFSHVLGVALQSSGREYGESSHGKPVPGGKTDLAGLDGFNSLSISGYPPGGGDRGYLRGFDHGYGYPAPPDSGMRPTSARPSEVSPSSGGMGLSSGGFSSSRNPWSGPTSGPADPAAMPGV
jgi:hypothetical protein